MGRRHKNTVESMGMIFWVLNNGCVASSTGDLGCWERRKRKRAAETQSTIWNGPGADTDRPLRRQTLSRFEKINEVVCEKHSSRNRAGRLGGLRLVVVDEQARELLAGKWHCVVAVVTVVAGRASLS